MESATQRPAEIDAEASRLSLRGPRREMRAAELMGALSTEAPRGTVDAHLQEPS